MISAPSFSALLWGLNIIAWGWYTQTICFCLMVREIVDGRCGIVEDLIFLRRYVCRFLFFVFWEGIGELFLWHPIRLALSFAASRQSFLRCLALLHALGGPFLRLFGEFERVEDDMKKKS